MSLFANIKSKIRTFDFDKVIVDYVNENNDELVDMQISQWDEGKASTGKKLRNNITGKTTYSKGYKRRKKKLGLSTSVVNLKLTNDFRNDTGVVLNNRTIVFTSFDAKTGLVTFQYNDVFGLDDKNFNKLQSGIKDSIGNKLINSL